jgi:hypothetical protein
MLLQTNSYIVPKEKRSEHARLMRRFRQVLHDLGCDNFEIYEQVGANWSNSQTTGRFVQIMRFRDRKHQLSVQNAERTDPAAQQLIAEFCELVNYPYQQQQGQFAIGFYSSILPLAPARGGPEESTEAEPAVSVDAQEPPVEEVSTHDAAEPAAQPEQIPQEPPGLIAEGAAVAATEAAAPPHLSLAGSETPDSLDGPMDDLVVVEEAAAEETVEPLTAEHSPETAPETVPETTPQVSDPPNPESTSPNPDADLQFDDEALSRLADELAIDDLPLDTRHADPSGGGSHPQGHASENGGH